MPAITVPLPRSRVRVTPPQITAASSNARAVPSNGDRCHPRNDISSIPRIICSGDTEPSVHGLLNKLRIALFQAQRMNSPTCECSRVAAAQACPREQSRTLLLVPNMSAQFFPESLHPRRAFNWRAIFEGASSAAPQRLQAMMFVAEQAAQTSAFDCTCPTRCCCRKCCRNISLRYIFHRYDQSSVRLMKRGFVRGVVRHCVTWLIKPLRRQIRSSRRKEDSAPSPHPFCPMIGSV